jgi:nucleotide-binding universal stress UspA family protein
MKAAPFNMLVATAGDAESAGAVRAAALLARRMAADVDVLTVVTPFPHAAPTGLLLETAAEVDEENRKAAVARVRAQLAGVRGAAQWPVRAVHGWPADAIVEAARRWHASLVVMGTGNHSAAARLFGSETAIGVAKRTDTPILAVPDDFERLPTRAFAAIDFTASSIDGARLAARLVPITGSVTLVHSTVFADATAAPGSMSDLYMTGAHDRLRTIAKQIGRATSRRVKTLVVDGRVDRVMAALAAKGSGALIALGSHERGLIDRLLMGSVRSNVLRHVPCPVLIVPRPAETRA